jgi:phosphomannomutase
MMRSGEFDFGFCFDGDGDRMDIMTKEGEQITPSFNLSILIPHINEFFKKVHALVSLELLHGTLTCITM